MSGIAGTFDGLYAAAEKRSGFEPYRVRKMDVEAVVEALLAELADLPDPVLRSALISRAIDDVWDVVVAAYNEGLGND